MNHNKDAVTKIFYELKEKECIEANRKILELENYPTFHAGICKIHYNRKMNELDENSIRISLLHEEGHIRLLYRTILFLIFLLGFFVLLVLSNLNPIFKILISIIVGLISSIVFLQIEEYDSDKFAAMTLRDIYGIPQPSKILEKTLEKTPHEGLSAYTHPSAHKRVKNIIDNVDRK